MSADDVLQKYGYDSVIRCLGFKVKLIKSSLVWTKLSRSSNFFSQQFDFSIFNETVKPHPSPSTRKDQYPHIKANYEALGIPKMYFGKLMY